MNVHALTSDEKQRLRNTEWWRLVPREKQQALNTVPAIRVPDVGKILLHKRHMTLAQAQAIETFQRIALPEGNTSDD